MSDLYVRTHTRGKKGIVRKSVSHPSPNVYPTDPAARRRLNTAVNDKHVRMPEGWQSGACDK